jgi:hypothetical protein
MLPEEMLLDRRLNFRDLFVFAVMVCGKPRLQKYVSIGQKLICKRARIDRRTFRTVRNKLIECGWLELIAADPASSKVPERAKYRLTAKVFSGEVETKPVVEDVDFSPILPTCPKCKRLCGGILAAGYCRRCSHQERKRREIAEGSTQAIMDALPKLREYVEETVDERLRQERGEVA